MQGYSFGNFSSTRGLCQGDPISPYLFLIVAEGLSAVLQHDESAGKIHGVKVAPSTPPVNHLFFANDSLLFCDAKIEEVTELKRVIDVYEKALGQKVNFINRPFVSVLPWIRRLKQKFKSCWVSLLFHVMNDTLDSQQLLEMISDECFGL
ncbi:hypothetical protein ACFX1Q_014913 [Malus domestica]